MADPESSRLTTWCFGYHGCGRCDGPCEAQMKETEDTGLIVYNAKADQPVIDWEAALAFYLLGVVTGSCVVFAIFSWLGLLE